MPDVLEVGETLPDFTLPDAAGREHSPSDHRGSWLLVSFYPQDDTPGCTKQACSVRDHWSDLRDAGIAVLSISPDGPESHAAFSEEYDLPHTLLCDPEKAVMEPLGAWGEKTLYGNTVVGVRRIAYLVDPEGVIRKVWKRVRTAQHGEDVLKAHAKLAG